MEKKINFISGVKVMTFAAIASFASVFGLSSCQDDSYSDDTWTNQTTKETTQGFENMSNASGAFTGLGTGKDAGLYVRFEGTRAQVVRNAGASEGGTNASVQFTGDEEGFINMDDNTFDIKSIPFCMSENYLELDMSGSADFTDFSRVCLCKKGNSLATRAANGDENKEIAINYAKTASAKILSLGAKAMFGDVGQAIADPILGAIFNVKSVDPNAQRFEDLKDEIAKLQLDVKDVANKVNYDNVCNLTHHHILEMTNLKERNALYLEKLRKHPERKDTILTKWAEGSADGPTLENGLKATLSDMTSKIGDRTIYNICDEYFFYMYAWEHEGYADRDGLRAFDILTFAQSCYLMSMYLDIDDSSEFKEDLEKAFDKYLDFMKYEGSYQKHEDKRICQIKGAYLEMDKALYEKTFGKGIDFSGKMDLNDGNKKNWAYAYLFSNHNPFEFKQEMKESMMKKKEIETIANHYGTTKMNVIFKDKLGIDNGGNNTLLLGEYAKTNFFDSNAPYFQDHSYTDIDGSVYFMDKNQYKSDEALGTVTFDNHNEGAGFMKMKVTLTFSEHKPKTVKYVKVNHHFNDYDAIVNHYRSQDIDAAKAARANN